jgi:predicted DNA-binding transcriptional regulator YafY
VRFSTSACAAARHFPEAIELNRLQPLSESLAALETKVLSAMRAGVRRRLAPDMEALLEAETMAVHPGPRPFEDEAVLGAVREAIVSLQRLRFLYDGGSTPGREREVTPYGLLFGRSNYLVAAEGAGGEPRNWRLDRVRDIRVVQIPGTRPADFSLAAYASRSFGIYQDAVEDVVLHILPHGAEEALGWRFHATQVLEPQPDGSVIARFRAAGMRELAWHLVTWRDAIEIAAWGLPRSGHCHREPGSACSLLACGFAWGCEP